MPKPTTTNPNKTNDVAPAATSKVLIALTAETPTVLGEKLRQVTIAHVVALESLGSPLVSPKADVRPGIMDNLRAVAVLSREGKEVLPITGVCEGFAEKVEADAARLAQTHTPAEIADACLAVQRWFYASFDTKLSAASEGGKGLGESTAASDGSPS